VLVNNRWTNPGHVTEEEHLCTTGCELLSILYTERMHLCCMHMLHVHLSAKLLPGYENNTPTHSTTPSALLHFNSVHVCQLIYILFCCLSITLAHF